MCAKLDSAVILRPRFLSPGFEDSTSARGGDRDIIENLCYTVLPARKSPALSGHSPEIKSWPIPSHSALIQYMAAGYKAPSYANPELKAKVDKAKHMAEHGLAKSTTVQYARAWFKWEQWVASFVTALPLRCVVTKL